MRPLHAGKPEENAVLRRGLVCLKGMRGGRRDALRLSGMWLMLQRNNDCDQLSKGLPALKRIVWREGDVCIHPGRTKNAPQSSPSPGPTPSAAAANWLHLNSFEFNSIMQHRKKTFKRARFWVVKKKYIYTKRRNVRSFKVFIAKEKSSDSING